MQATPPGKLSIARYGRWERATRQPPEAGTGTTFRGPASPYATIRLRQSIMLPGNTNSVRYP